MPPNPTAAGTLPPAAALADVTIDAWRQGHGHCESRRDQVIVEAPLLIRLGHTTFAEGQPVLNWHDLVVTMRTPGDDARLAIGYLIAEGIIEHRSQVADIRESVYREEGASTAATASPWPEPQPAMVAVTLEPSCQISATCLNQRRLASSSCGICGKTALSDLLKRTPFPRSSLPAAEPRPELLAAIDSQTRLYQPLFQRCGAVHSCGLFTAKGQFVAMFEDVGRHNAFDKLTGYLCQQEQLPPGEWIVWLSGRISYELTQKAIMAGIGTLVAVGAPSQLAVYMAQKAHIRLIGFADGKRFNVY